MTCYRWQSFKFHVLNAISPNLSGILMRQRPDIQRNCPNAFNSWVHFIQGDAYFYFFSVLTTIVYDDQVSDGDDCNGVNGGSNNYQVNEHGDDLNPDLFLGRSL